jgi:Subtilisin inhibitor-like
MSGRRSALAIGLALLALAGGAVLVSLLWPHAAAARTDLRIQAWSNLRLVKQAEMRCHPAGGDLPDPAGACRELAAYSERWLPTQPTHLICVTSGAGGGPRDIVRIDGRYEGRRVSYRLFAGTCGYDLAFAGWWDRILHLSPP